MIFYTTPRCGCPVDTSASAEAPTEPAGETGVPYDVFNDIIVGATFGRPQNFRNRWNTGDQRSPLRCVISYRRLYIEVDKNNR